MFASYAQNFEDVMLWRALKHVERGCYVDVGAQHPRIDSVSRAFYERGWRGVHVEPVPHYAAMLREDRPDELVLEAAVAESPGSRTLYVLQDTGLSTLDAELAARHERERGYARHQLVVPTLTLSQVFEAAQQPQTHWLKIDVEGAEREVVAGWDRQRWRPWIVVIESTIPNTQIDDSDLWEDLLLGSGYRFVYFDGINRWHVRDESPELVEAFRAPPNFFDDFVRIREVEAEQARAALAAAKDELETQLSEMRNETSRQTASLAQQAERFAERLAEREQEWNAQRESLMAQLAEARAELATLARHLAGREHEFAAQLVDSERRWSLQLAAAKDEALQRSRQAAQQAERFAERLANREREWSAQLAASQRDHAAALAAAVERERQGAAEAVARAIDAEEQKRQLQQALEQAQAKIAELNGHSHHWWSVADSLNTELQRVYASRSWRITQPLRWLDQQRMRLRQQGLRARAKALVNRVSRRVMAAIEARPGLKQRIVAWAHRLGWYAALRRLYRRLAAQSAPAPAVAAPGRPPESADTGESLTPWTRHMAQRLGAARAGIKPGAQ